jgi:hypothetical protein
MTATGQVEAAASESFSASRELFESVAGFLDGTEAAGLEHAELETQLQSRGRELVRQLMQDHLDLRAQREQRLEEVADAEGVARGGVETGHERRLTTVFGEVTVTRLAYRRRGHSNLYPADAALNLPVEKHSHVLRKLAAIEASRGSLRHGRRDRPCHRGPAGQTPSRRTRRSGRGRLRRLLRPASTATRCRSGCARPLR